MSTNISQWQTNKHTIRVLEITKVNCINFQNVMHQTNFIEGRALDCSLSIEMYGEGMRNNMVRVRPLQWSKRDKSYPILFVCCLYQRGWALIPQH